MTKVERYAPLVVWLFFGFETLRLGYWIPRNGVDSAEISVSAKVAIILVSFVGSAITAASAHRGEPGTSVMARVARRGRFEWIGVMFFGGGGLLATVHCLLVGDSETNLFLPLVLLSVGLGILSGHLIGAWRKNAASPQDTAS